MAPRFRNSYFNMIVELTTGLQYNQDGGGLGSKLSAMFDDMFSVMPIARFGPGLKTRDALVEILCDIVRDNLQKNRALIERLRGYGEDELVRQVTKEIRSGVDNINVLLITIASSTLSTDPRSKPDEEEVMNVAVSMCLLWLAGNATSAAASQVHNIRARKATRSCCTVGG